MNEIKIIVLSDLKFKSFVIVRNYISIFLAVELELAMQLPYLTEKTRNSFGRMFEQSEAIYIMSEVNETCESLYGTRFEIN